ncbi:MAG: hypothetical protein ACLRT5_10690 [Lachnospiraceae bacterium]
MGNARNQRGNPEEGGKLIVETAMQETSPFRLLLGSDAVHAAKTVMEDRLNEIRAWESTSRQSDFAK